jgi:very-short-patch-repair endonuclease
VHPYVRLRRDAVARYGVSSRQVAARLGVAPSTYDDWRRVEGAVTVHRGVVVLPDVPTRPEQPIAAALLAVGTGAVAGGTTAPYLHGWRDGVPDPLTILVPYGRWAPTLTGGEVVQTRRLPATDRTVVRRLACTVVERTLLDLVMDLGSGDEGLAIVLTALQRRATTIGRLRAIVNDAGPRRGRQLERVLDRLGDGTQPDSIFEHLVAERLRADGLDPVVGHPVTAGAQRCLIDLAFPDERVAVECDGFAFHRTPRDLARDHERQNALVRAGWRVLRNSWHRWSREPEAVVGELRELLASAP